MYSLINHETIWTTTLQNVKNEKYRRKTQKWVEMANFMYCLKRRHMKQKIY